MLLAAHLVILVKRHLLEYYQNKLGDNELLYRRFTARTKLTKLLYRQISRHFAIIAEGCIAYLFNNNVK